MAEAGGSDFTGSECYLTGWGRMSGFANGIAEGFPWYFKIKPSHLCFYTGKGGACQGDSGGPAVCKENGAWVLAGVTSGGSPICNVKKPSIYTRVSAFRDWINEHSGL